MDHARGRDDRVGVGVDGWVYAYLSGFSSGGTGVQGGQNMGVETLRMGTRTLTGWMRAWGEKAHPEEVHANYPVALREVSMSCMRGTREIGK